MVEKGTADCVRVSRDRGRFIVRTNNAVSRGGAHLYRQIMIMKMVIVGKCNVIEYRSLTEYRI